MSDKSLYFTINGLIMIINIFIYFVFCNSNSMVKALVSGLSWKWLIVFFSPVLFIVINEVKKLSIKYHFEDRFIYTDEILNVSSYIIGLIVIILSFYNLFNSFDYLAIKVIFVLGIASVAFNIYHLITGKEV